MKQSFTLIILLLIATRGYGQAQVVSIDSLKNAIIKYDPTRIAAGGQEGYPLTWIGVEQEYRIVKNTLNIGAMVDYGYPKGGEYHNMMAGIYLAPYIAVNRTIFNNYSKQNEGLFLFAKLGYAAYQVFIPGVDTAIDSGPVYGIGGDFLITPYFGLTAQGFFYTNNNEPAIVEGGLVFNF